MQDRLQLIEIIVNGLNGAPLDRQGEKPSPQVVEQRARLFLSNALVLVRWQDTDWLLDRLQFANLAQVLSHSDDGFAQAQIMDFAVCSQGARSSPSISPRKPKYISQSFHR